VPNQEILEWLANKGMTELYTSNAVANPTTSDVLLFSHTPSEGILMLRFTFMNDCPVSTTYAIQTSVEGEWVDVVRPVAYPNLVEQMSMSFPVDAGVPIRVGVVANAEASGTSRVVVEYIDA